MDPSVAAPAAAKDADVNDAATQNPTFSDDDVKMEDFLDFEAATKPSEATQSGVSKPQAERHDSVISEDIIEPKPSSALTKNAKTQARQTDPGISGAKPASTEPAAADVPVPSTEKKPNLGSSILQTPSSTASFQASPTLSPYGSPSLDSSVFKAPPKRHTSPPPSKAAGSTWVYDYGGKWWPVIICDERTTPKTFMENRRKGSHLPTILLGKRI